MPCANRNAATNEETGARTAGTRTRLREVTSLAFISLQLPTATHSFSNSRAHGQSVRGKEPPRNTTTNRSPGQPLDDNTMAAAPLALDKQHRGLRLRDANRPITAPNKQRVAELRANGRSKA